MIGFTRQRRDLEANRSEMEASRTRWNSHAGN